MFWFGMLAGVTAAWLLGVFMLLRASRRAQVLRQLDLSGDEVIILDRMAGDNGHDPERGIKVILRDGNG